MITATGVVLAVLAAFGLQAVDVSGDHPPARAAAAVDPCAVRPDGTLPTHCVEWLSGWRPQLGVVFNDPLGTPAEQKAIVSRVIAAINHTRPGETIRMAVYSFDRGDVLAALDRARQRGVEIQVIVNKRVLSNGVRALRRQLGRNPDRPHFVIACPGTCRKAGEGGNMHAKVYSFSRSGGARYLVITASGNMTSKGVYRQWNDSYAVANDQALFDSWSRMFNQMAHQRRVGARKITYTTTSGDYNYAFQRSLPGRGGPAPYAVSTTASRYRPYRDPAWRKIRRISCQAAPGFGRRGHTVIRIAMYGMFKERGEGLAQALVRKKQQGCDVRLIMSVPGGSTYKMMERAGIPLRSGDWMFAERIASEEDGISGWGPRFYTHLKFMAVSGTVGGRSVKTVTTGSENWDGLSMANEEVVLTINDPTTYQAYVSHWNSLWQGRATHRMGIEPRRGP